MGPNIKSKTATFAIAMRMQKFVFPNGRWVQLWLKPGEIHANATRWGELDTPGSPPTQPLEDCSDIAYNSENIITGSSMGILDRELGDIWGERSSVDGPGMCRVGKTEGGKHSPHFPGKGGTSEPI